MSVSSLIRLVLILVSVIGLWHGFPSLDHFADESYFVTSPFIAIESLNPFPKGLPYGTALYLCVLPLHALLLAILFVLNGMSIAELQNFILAHPHIPYYVPRVFNALMYVCIGWWILYTTKKELSFHRIIAGILCLFNALLVTYIHSGKMWILSTFLVLLAGLQIEKKPILALILLSISLGNFPLMGIFWLCGVLTVLSCKPRSLKRILHIVMAAVLPCMLLSFINYHGIYGQVQDIIYNYLQPSVTVQSDGHTVLSFVHLYTRTLGTYIWRWIHICAPLLVLAAFTIRYGKVKQKQTFLFATLSLISFFFVSGLFAWSTSPGTYLRYLIPLPILLYLFVYSFEVGYTKVIRCLLTVFAVLSIYTAVSTSISLALDSTYVDAYQKISEEHNAADITILSSVSQISFPLSSKTAQYLAAEMPGRCGSRCKSILEQPSDMWFMPTYILVHPRELEEISIDPDVRIVVNSKDTNFVDAENWLGSYLAPATWWPQQLGQFLLLQTTSI